MSEFDKFVELMDRRDKERDSRDQMRDRRQDEINDRLEKNMTKLVETQQILVNDSHENRTAFNHINRVIDTHSTSIHDLEKSNDAMKVQLAQNAQTVSVFVRVSWVIVTAIVGGYISMMYASSQKSEKEAQILEKVVQALEKK